MPLIARRHHRVADVNPMVSEKSAGGRRTPNRRIPRPYPARYCHPAATTIEQSLWSPSTQGWPPRLTTAETAPNPGEKGRGEESRRRRQTGGETATSPHLVVRRSGVHFGRQMRKYSWGGNARLPLVAAGRTTSPAVRGTLSSGCRSRNLISSVVTNRRKPHRRIPRPQAMPNRRFT